MQRIIPRLRSEVFEGVHILFSSVIPLDTQPETTEIWRLAHMFGARVSTELKSDITHVVAAKVCPFIHKFRDGPCVGPPRIFHSCVETTHSCFCCSFPGIEGTATD
jgi:hypothetical protein